MKATIITGDQSRHKTFIKTVLDSFDYVNLIIVEKKNLDSLLYLWV